MNNQDVTLSQPLEIALITLFPEVIAPYLQSSIFFRAIQKGAVRVEVFQMRDFATDRHRTVDDSPYGGGAGMVLRADVLDRAWQAARNWIQAREVRTVLLSPQGPVWSSARAYQAAADASVGRILVCGHYEGVDQRFIQSRVDEEVSVGDYVLTGGELAALIWMDSTIRFLPNVLGNTESWKSDSLEYSGSVTGAGMGLLKYPQYTRPNEACGLLVPEVLLSGDHGSIANWRLEQAKSATQTKRPDLWSRYLDVPQGDPQN